MKLNKKLIIAFVCLCLNLQSFVVINDTNKTLRLKITEAADMKPDAKGNVDAPKELNKDAKYFTVEPKSIFVIEKFIDSFFVYLDYKKVSVERTATGSVETSSNIRKLYSRMSDNKNKKAIKIRGDWGILLEERTSLNEPSHERFMSKKYKSDFIASLLNPCDEQDLKILAKYRTK